MQTVRCVKSCYVELFLPLGSFPSTISLYLYVRSEFCKTLHCVFVTTVLRLCLRTPERDCWNLARVCILGFQFVGKKRELTQQYDYIIDVFMKALNFYSHESFFFVSERASSSMLANLFGKSILS